MKYREVESQQDLIDYYEELLDYLDDNIPCLDTLIELFNEGEDE